MVEKDAEFLRSCGVIDYSLLVGVEVREGESGRGCCVLKNDRRKNSPWNVDNDLGCENVVALKGVYVSRPADIYLGVIDFFQEWTVRKRVERAWKMRMGMRREGDISAANPTHYAKRFIEFIGREIG